MSTPKRRNRIGLMIVSVVGFVVMALSIVGVFLPDQTNSITESLIEAPIPAEVNDPSAAPNTSVQAGDGLPTSTADMKAGWLWIPSIGVYAPYELHGMGQTSQGYGLQIPSDEKRLSLYRDGGMPCGDKGIILLAGHVMNGVTRPGALLPLSKVQAGAVAYLKCDSGQIDQFKLTKVATPLKAELNGVFNDEGPVSLQIITCGGRVVNHKFTHNVQTIWARF